MQLLTIAQLSEMTGLSRSWWRQAIAHGLLASVKLGGALRVRADELERFIAARERPAVERTLREDLDAVAAPNFVRPDPLAIGVSAEAGTG